MTCVNPCHPWPFWFFLASLVFCCIHKVLYYFMVSFFYRQYPWAVSTNQRNKIFAEVLFTFVYLKKIGMGSHDKWQRSAITFSINVLLHCLKYHNVAGCCLPLALNDDGSDEDVVICKLLIRLSIKIWNVYDNFGEKKQRKRHTRSICPSLWQHGKLKILLFRLFPGLFKITVPQRENKIAYCC